MQSVNVKLRPVARGRWSGAGLPAAPARSAAARPRAWRTLSPPPFSSPPVAWPARARLARVRARAPTAAEIERIGREVLAEPAPSFARTQGVVIKVEDFPDEETEREMELESPRPAGPLPRRSGRPRLGVRPAAPGR